MCVSYKMKYDDSQDLIKAAYKKFAPDGKMDILQFSKLASNVIKFSDEIADKKNKRKSGANSTIDPGVLAAVFAYYDNKSLGWLGINEVIKWWNDPCKLFIFSLKGGKVMKDAYEFFIHNSTKSDGISMKVTDTGSVKLGSVKITSMTEYIPRIMTFSQFENFLDSHEISHNDTTFDQHDANEDGLLNFCEFVNWLGWIKQATK